MDDAQVGDCAALADLYLSGNLIEVVPAALGHLKEKKVRRCCKDDAWQ